jgi:hypothetical protein
LTLLIAAANADLAFLMADRRMTRSDGTADDETNKLVVVRFGGADFLVGFTGLAEVANLPTSEWFAEAVAAVGQSTAAAVGVLDGVAERLTTDIARSGHSAKWARLSIVGIGFVDADSAPVPAWWRLSNFERGGHIEQSARPQVELERYQAVPEHGSWTPLVVFAGSGSDHLRATRADVEALIDLLDGGAHPSRLAHHAYRIVTGIADVDDFVGSQANAAFITPDGATRYRYFTQVPVAGTLFPIIVDLTGSLGPRVEHYGDARRFGRLRTVGDIRFLLDPVPFLASDEPTEFPKQERAAYCVCGSGRKARNCHRRETERWRDVPIQLSIEAGDAPA